MKKKLLTLLPYLAALAADFYLLPLWRGIQGRPCC